MSTQRRRLALLKRCEGVLSLPDWCHTPRVCTRMAVMSTQIWCLDRQNKLSTLISHYLLAQCLSFSLSYCIVLYYPTAGSCLCAKHSSVGLKAELGHGGQLWPTSCIVRCSESSMSSRARGLPFSPACCSRPVRPFSSPADSLLSSHTPRPVRSPKDSRSPLMYTTCQPPQRVSYSMQWLHLPHRLFLVLCSVWYIFFFSPSISLSIQLSKRLQGIYGWISVSTLTKSPEPLRT